MEHPHPGHQSSSGSNALMAIVTVRCASREVASCPRGPHPGLPCTERPVSPDPSFPTTHPPPRPHLTHPSVPHVQALGISATGVDAKELEEQALLEVNRLRGGHSFVAFLQKPEACDVTLKCHVKKPAAPAAATACPLVQTPSTFKVATKRERSFSSASSVSTATTLPADDQDEEVPMIDVSSSDETAGEQPSSEDSLASPLLVDDADTDAALLQGADDEDGGAGGKRKRSDADRAQKKRKAPPTLPQQYPSPQPQHAEDGDKKMAAAAASLQQQQQQQQQQQRQPQPQPQGVHTIFARSTILAEKSPYFDRAFRGGWKEGSERQVVLHFDEEADFQDFARLVRLCHGPSFTRETSVGGEGTRGNLRREELLRLLLVADSFEVVQCVEDCVANLCVRMNYSLATKVFQRVPESLKNHAHIRKLLLAAGTALAKGVGVLGPKAWSRRRPDVAVGGKDKYMRFLPDLQPRLQQLSPLAMECLLQSPALRLKSENDAFAFVCAWLKGQQGWSKAETQRAFNALMPCLRWHNMTSEFLATVVSQCRLVVQSGRLLDVLRGALCFRDAGSHIKRYVVHQAAQQHAEQQHDHSDDEDGDEEDSEAERLAKRAALKAYETRAEDEDDEVYVLKGTFSLAKCLTLPPGKFVRRYLGVVQGLPVFLDLERSVLEGGGEQPRRRETLGLFLGICNSGSERTAMGGSSNLPVGCLVRYDISVGSVTRGPSIDIFANAKQPWGYRDVLNKDWAEVVRAGSPHFDRNGRLEVTARVRFLREARLDTFYGDEDVDDEEDDDSSDEEEQLEDEDEDEEEEEVVDEEDQEEQAEQNDHQQQQGFVGPVADAAAAEGGGGGEEGNWGWDSSGDEFSDGSADA